jgi:hypothetical protein
VLYWNTVSRGKLIFYDYVKKGMGCEVRQADTLLPVILAYQVDALGFIEREPFFGIGRS